MAILTFSASSKRDSTSNSSVFLLPTVRPSPTLQQSTSLLPIPTDLHYSHHNAVLLVQHLLL